MSSDEEKRQGPQEPPNGGARAWGVALGAFAAQITTFLSSQSSNAISWIGSLQAFFLFLLGAISGPLSDRLGVKAVVIPSGLTLGVLGGMACGMIFTPVVSCVGQYFTTRRAWAMVVVVSGAAVGGIIFPITLNRLLISFGWSVRDIGFIMLVLIIYAAFQWPYILTNAGFLLALLGHYAPIFYIPDYALERRMSSQLALYQVAILNAPSFFGRLIPNFAGDKLGRFNITIFTYAACAILLFCWTAAISNAAIMVWIAFFGFLSGGAFSLYSPSVAQVCPNPSDISTNYGYLEASMFSGAAFMAGLIYQIIARLLLEKRPWAVA
ncbi:monocarboxylate transporter [Penicillium cinerascens]|uniref:Monocarboxylate transporter n=1 Tax=Penicillium cinerascens TaxID=70096 RepID=A0A9W9JF01_9EURO|nr:monocarboxylate transporter [Penicillium cinerascens]KAJ5194772.1 monocarboxylate transporter [Penicillium cinerascens]